MRFLSGERDDTLGSASRLSPWLTLRLDSEKGARIRRNLDVDKHS